MLVHNTRFMGALTSGWLLTLIFQTAIKVIRKMLEMVANVNSFIFICSSPLTFFVTHVFRVNPSFLKNASLSKLGPLATYF